MGSQTSFPVTTSCMESKKPSKQLEKVVSVIFHEHAEATISDKQNLKALGEDEKLQKSIRPYHERVKIFSSVLPANARDSQRKTAHLQEKSIDFDSDIQDAKRQAQRHRYSMDFEQLLLLQSNRGGLSQQSSYQLFLTVDQKWLDNMSKRQRDPLDFSKIYKLNDECLRLSTAEMIKFTRRGYDGRKMQLLFKQQVPMMGKYYFEVQLFSYDTKNKCEFTIGFVEYYKAQNNVHSRDSCIEQSYTHKEYRNLFDDSEEESKIVQLNKKFRIQICREENHSLFAVYMNGQQLMKKELRADMVKKSIAIVPFIQTQYEGVEFGWQSPKAAFTL